MTFPAHQGLILPIVRKYPRHFDALALSVGAAMPDITDSVLGLLTTGHFKHWYGHALVGVFALDIPVGMLIAWALTVFAVHALKNKSVIENNAARSWRVKLRLWRASVTVGVFSHLAFDLISHDSNMLLYPWLENPQWLPAWWYPQWFVIHPLPVFWTAYSVGLFTVMWSLLTLIGVVLFFKYMKSENKNEMRNL